MNERIRTKPLHVCFLFLSGALVGGVAPDLMQTQAVTAAPQGTGLPHVNALGIAANAREIAAVKELLGGWSRNGEGALVVDGPVRFRDPTEMSELLIHDNDQCARIRPDRIELLVDCGPEEVPVASLGRSLDGSSAQFALTDLETARCTRIRPDRVELLVDCGPEEEVAGIFQSNDDGSSLVQATDVVGEFITETGGPLGPFPEDPGPF